MTLLAPFARHYRGPVAVASKALTARLLLVAAALVTCTASGCAKSTAERGLGLWQERCKTSGEFIHKVVEDVDGIFLLTLRTTLNFDDQYRLDDPYGSDSIGTDYILNFLQGFYYQPPNARPQGFPPRTGYRFVEARDSEDGQLYRYTGRYEEPWQANKSYLKGYVRFVLDRTLIRTSSARYGVRFDDISTRTDREHWIAGSSLKVVDLQTQAVIGERLGYMIDLAQGSRAKQRSPWLLAANNACPSFDRNYPGRVPVPGAALQGGQTLDFVEKVLRPSK
ncbi:hypothetical protein [Thauera sp. 2A1]|uniref:hypothetical protein n=1 Tax=Thauera sp. 2A1 TaxID=2570191 RepID=UPI001292091D|nr:hypothetical protein [Thauera sp. 2A1]KAI5912435.1 hypothetical protein GH664_22360 [Thauera sp. 2A1]